MPAGGVCGAGRHFYPRPPRGGRQVSGSGGGFAGSDFYPRPPRGGRPAGREGGYMAGAISTHALREEGDLVFPIVNTSAGIFLPTPSARRATRTAVSFALFYGYFYPRPPRGGRLPDGQLIYLSNNISTHALREEGDGRRESTAGRVRYFYPRPPRGGRRS